MVTIPRVPAHCHAKCQNAKVSFLFSLTWYLVLSQAVIRETCEEERGTKLYQ